MALTCNLDLLASLPTPVVEERPVTRLGKQTVDGEELAGVNVTIRSAYPLDAWAEVIRHPERTDEWQPEDVGTKQAERLDHGHIYQRTDLSLLFGAAHIKRQAVIGIQWLQDDATALRNCWYATDPAPFAAKVGPWDDGSTYLDVGYGGWTATATPQGGTIVSYQIWTSARILPAQVQAWVLSQGLPQLLAVFDAHVGEVTAQLHPNGASQG